MAPRPAWNTILVVVLTSVLHTHAPRWRRDLVFNLAGVVTSCRTPVERHWLVGSFRWGDAKSRLFAGFRVLRGGGALATWRA